MNKDRSWLGKAILSDAKAKKSYDRLLSKGLKSTDLLIELVGWAAVETEKKPQTQYSALGITRKTIAYLSTRLRSLADELEKLNAKRNQKRMPGPMGQALRSIRWLVRHETGRENCGLLKHILAAATPDSEFHFETALKMNAHRHPLPPLNR